MRRRLSGDLSRRRPVMVAVIAVMSLGSLMTAEASKQQGYLSTYAVDVSRDAYNGGAEPWVAVNPRNTRNVVETYNSAIQYGSKVQAPRYSGACSFATSFDRGHTWRRGTLPITDAVYSGCGDNLLTVGPDGTFYATGLVVPPCVCGFEVRVTTSRDGGRTWGPFSVPFGPRQSLRNYEHGRAEQVVLNQSPDREWFAVDESTNKVYASTVYAYDPDPDPLNEGREWVNVTSDGGRTWGTPRPLDDENNWPRYSGGPGSIAVLPLSPSDREANNGMVAASHGTLAAIYLAGRSPDRHVACPCEVFETSRDDGVSWKRRVVPFRATYIAADPSVPGRFVVLAGPQVTTQADSLSVYVTNDFGQSWRRGQALRMRGGDKVSEPWIAFAPHTHAIGLMWKQVHGDGTFDVLTGVSRDLGLHFPLVKLTGEPSPGTGLRGTGALDDTSALVLDDHYAHVAWGDGRGGGTNAWYGQIRYR